MALTEAPERSLALFPDGRHEFVREPYYGKGVIWSTEDMARYCEMNERERQIFRSFKMRWSARTIFRLEKHV